jgi:hypothetical protein
MMFFKKEKKKALTFREELADAYRNSKKFSDPMGPGTALICIGWHLEKHHGFTRDQVADWFETLGSENAEKEKV